MNKKVSEVIAGQRLVSLKPDQTVGEALQQLAKNNIISAPVCDESNGQLKAKGVIDVLDLVSCLVKVSTRVLTTLSSGESRYLTEDDALQLARRSKEFRLTQIQDVLGSSQRNQLVTVSDNLALKDALLLFMKERCHRVVVVDNSTQNCVGILSQSHFLEYLSRELLNNVPDLRNVTISRCQITPVDQLQQVKQGVHAIDAFMRMNECNLSSLAVVDNANNIVDTISATDLKGIVSDFRSLLLPVEQYLEKTRKEVLGKREAGLQTCAINTPLVEAIEKVLQKHLHRLYVLDEQRRPAGVVSLTDITAGLGSVNQLMQLTA